MTGFVLYGLGCEYLLIVMQIMVMDEGQIVEFDRYGGLIYSIYSLKLTILYSPGSLISNEGSRFHKLCKAAGIEEFSKLKAMAQ